MQDWQDLGCLGSGYRCRGVRDQQNGLDEPFDGVPPVELHDHSTSGPPLSPSAVALLTTMVSTYLGRQVAAGGDGGPACVRQPRRQLVGGSATTPWPRGLTRAAEDAAVPALCVRRQPSRPDTVG
jgi:hypothetical protein